MHPTSHLRFGPPIAVRVRALVLALLAVHACAGGERATAPTGRAGLRFVAGADARDTVGATLATPLVAELRDSAGRSIPNSPLLFSVTPGDATLRSTTSSQPSVGTSLIAMTNSAGRASVLLRLGTVAKAVTVRVLDGARSWNDSVQVTALPGTPVRLELEPRDTALLVGRSVRHRTSVLDRFGNPTPGTSSVSVSGSTLSTRSGGEIVANAIGRATVYARSGAFTDSVFVSVVPPGLLATYAIMYGQAGKPGGIYVLNTDGSNARWAYRTTIPVNQTESFGFWPALSPDGSRVTFVETATLRLVPSGGGTAVDLATGVSDEYAPQFSADGQWIYFTRGSFGSQNTVWRIRPDGSGLAQVSEVRGWGIEAMPSPSPIDDRVAYQTNDATNSPIDFTIRLVSTTTGVVRKLDVRGYSPRWSPLGDRIAYLGPDNQLTLLDAAGAPLGKIGPGIAAQKGFIWSPAADWLLVVNTGFGVTPGLRLVEAATARTLVLPLAGPDGQRLFHPSWVRLP